MKYKFAYPEKDRKILLSVSRLPIMPVFDEEIEITSINNNLLKGNLVHYENSRIVHDLDSSDVRDEYLYSGKRFILFGKEVKKIKGGWVRLKKVTPIEMELKNMVVIKIKGEK